MGTKIQKLVFALIIASTLASYTQSALAGSIKAWGVMAVDSNALVGNFTVIASRCRPNINHSISKGLENAQI